MKTSHLKPNQRVVITSKNDWFGKKNGTFLRRDGRMAVFYIDDFVGMRGEDDKGITTISINSKDFEVIAEEKH
ncbi:hypothetical protein DMT89_12090 [Salmonella enterica]|nr:hypothetical protein [Salmonella enterica]EBW7236499.1 hypothetical protein [Salmonella enterica subsp. enterica serovar Senftenberg]ECD5495386.1 hypothetical protein [Salmonella enterica subsp. enterica serovar Duesseldorf]EDD6560770.1 hypothetical protein [Salmonella enterica subsp. enterica serovar Enteritidis]EGR9571942.1 hypothetical protein [Salmonella enterica subsp. enterica serovar Grumpensis]